MPAITIRDVPQETRNELAARAARSGRSLQEFLRGELIELASRPTAQSVVDRMRERVHRTGTRIDGETIVKLIHEERR
jgi:hypothetical protein